MNRPAKNPAFDVIAYLSKEAPGCVASAFRKNQSVFRQGANSDAVYYIKSGKVKISIQSSKAQEAVLAILGPDSFFGEGCLGEEREHLTAATAISDCSIVRIEHAEIQRLLREHPLFSRMFIERMLTKSARAQDDLMDQHFSSQEKRLARVLLLMAEFGEGASKALISDPVDQGTLAEMVGATRSRVSFFMNKFRRLGHVEYNNGHLIIHLSITNILEQNGKEPDPDDISAD